MSEYTLQAIASLKICWAGFGTVLYGAGGIRYKFLRRFLLPLWMGLGIWVFGTWQGDFQWWMLSYSALLCASLHLGYGGTDNVFIKIRKRTIYGLALGVSAMPICFVSGMWVLFGWHIGICVVASVLFGVFNITDSARSEESIIDLFSTVIPLFLIN